VPNQRIGPGLIGPRPAPYFGYDMPHRAQNLWGVVLSMMPQAEFSMSPVGPNRPRVAIIGGPDVHGRLDLMKHLAIQYELFAVGSDPSLASIFESHHFRYFTYRLVPSANIFADTLATAQLFRLLRRERPAIAHAFDTKPCVLARLAARLAGVPVIIGTMPGLGTLYADETDRRWTRRIIRFLYEPLQRLASSVSGVTIVQNEDDAAEMVRRKLALKRKLRVIPGSGVNIDRFNRDAIPPADIARLRGELGIPSRSVVVIMVSRLIRAKGVREYAEAAREVRASGADVHFLLVGPFDRDAQGALSWEEVHWISREVQWTGSRDNVATLYALSDIAILPSYYREGVPRVLLEAAAMGLPLITTDMPGCRDVVRHDVNGLLVPPKDTSALVAAIVELVRNTAKRAAFGVASRDLVTRRFSSTLIARQVEAVYADLLSRRRGLNWKLHER
jgi:glycosyltransferase involved in cell wall biosynthesis